MGGAGHRAFPLVLNIHCVALLSPGVGEKARSPWSKWRSGVAQSAVSDVSLGASL